MDGSESLQGSTGDCGGSKDEGYDLITNDRDDGQQVQDDKSSSERHVSRDNDITSESST